MFYQSKCWRAMFSCFGTADLKEINPLKFCADTDDKLMVHRTF